MDTAQYQEIARAIVLRSPYHTKAIISAVIVTVVLIGLPMVGCFFYAKYKAEISMAKLIWKVFRWISSWLWRCCCECRRKRKERKGRKAEPGEYEIYEQGGSKV
jgi:hypothetical protein